MSHASDATPAKRLDLTPFALPNTGPGEVRFEEPRDIEALAVAFKEAPPAMKVQYLQRRWPEYNCGWMPIERYPFHERPFDFGWYPIDDQFSSSWRDAAVVERV